MAMNEEEVVSAIADDLINLAGGETRKAMVLAAAYIPSDSALGFGDAEAPCPPRFGSTDYAGDWS